MAQPTNTFDTYDSVGIRENLADFIDDVSPDATPFYSKCAKANVSNTYTEWQTDALRSSADNKHIEGDDTTADAVTPTTRLGNYTQIFKNAVVVPDTDEGISKAGRNREIAYQTLKIAKEQKLDIEKALFANNARVAGDSSTARELAGVPAWLKTNTVFESGNLGANPTGDGSDARTDDGTPVAFSQSRFNAAMQNIWENSREDGGFTCYLSAFQMSKANDFIGNNNQRNTVARGAVADYVDIYMTSWGQVKFQMSRECRSRDVFILKDTKWDIGVLRAMKNVELAKTGDSTRRQIVCELTLRSRNEAASGGVFDNTTS